MRSRRGSGRWASTSARRASSGAWCRYIHAYIQTSIRRCLDATAPSLPTTTPAPGQYRERDFVRTIGVRHRCVRRRLAAPPGVVCTRRQRRERSAREVVLLVRSASGAVVFSVSELIETSVGGVAQAMLSRGDRRLGPVLISARDYGDTLGSFRRAFKDHK
eukprot:9503785-Pyramimonas_sp.AAC.1